jgi:hypothetical protein
MIKSVITRKTSGEWIGHLFVPFAIRAFSGVTPQAKQINSCRTAVIQPFLEASVPPVPERAPGGEAVAPPFT